MGFYEPGCSKKLADALLDRWPMRRPGNWAALVNAGLDEPERASVQASLERGRPLGDVLWTMQTAKRMGQGYTLNPRGRPPGNAKADANKEK